jgi:hypothetical protein
MALLYGLPVILDALSVIIVILQLFRFRNYSEYQVHGMERVRMLAERHVVVPL